ncbi:MAG: glutamate--tRNA ligase, partial [Paratractidigestivibacter faecalis]
AETLEYDEKSVAKGLAKEGMGAILDAAREALLAVPADAWTPEAIDGALDPLPEALDAKKRIVFQAVRVAECGNMVSPPLGETMALIGRDDCLARLDRARAMAL